MKKTFFYAVIGKNFGDEGKGMAVDFLSLRHRKTLVIRQNGGAQSGHTVELKDGRRFVFQELSSGSFRGADTFWANTFYPDLYKLGEEVDAFNKINGSAPTVYAERSACFTIIDDILLNMAAEVARGEHKHGSCGMGIYEAKCRCEAGYGIQIGELQTLDLDSLVLRLKDIRKKYLPLRFKQLQLSANELGDYGELLQSDEILYNFAIAIMDHFKYVHVVEEVKPFLEEYDGVIFENGQGLLLDSENIEYAPHVTASRTGIIGPHNYLKRFGFALDEVVYVTRSYVTRHGAGPLPLECAKEKIGIVSEDGTNVTNQWQGALRYAKHENLSRFVEPVNADCYEAIKEKEQMPLRSLMITHLNETGDCVVFNDTDCRISDLIKEAKWKETFGRFYISKTRYSEEMESL